MTNIHLENVRDSYGAMLVQNCYTFHIFNSEFRNNTSLNGFGGGFALVGNYKTNFTIYNTSFIENKYLI